MVVAFSKHPERGKGIGVQGLPWLNGFFGKGLDGVLVYPVNGFHGDKTRPPTIVFTGDQDGRLAAHTAPTLARTLAADEGIVQFDDAFVGRYRRFWSPIATRSFRSIRWAVIQGTPISLVNRKADMLPLSVDIQ
jgi:hypothetical protein